MYASEGGIMAYSSYANLTFAGGELNIKDLTAGTNGAYLVKATEGGSIIFDNTVVDIGAGNNTTSSIGLQSAGQGSKISFGKNVEQLTIKSATGIVVEGGGSLEFNSVDGITILDVMKVLKRVMTEYAWGHSRVAVVVYHFGRQRDQYQSWF